MRVGRNAPCPCGSGRKYKKCCMAVDQAGADEITPRLVARSADEAAQAAMAFAARTRGEGFYDRAWRAFFADDDASFMDDEEPLTQLIIPWALYVSDPDSGGHDAPTVGRQLLDSPAGRQLSARSRAYVEACCEAPLAFWQVDATQPGVGLSMRDLVSGREVFVHEDMGSTTIQVGDIMFGQIVAVDTIHILSISSPYTLPAIPYRPQIESMLAEVSDEGELIDIYLECLAALLQPPAIHNTEGDRLEWVTSTFDFEPPQRHQLLTRLEGMRNIVGDPQQPGDVIADFQWLSQGSDPHPVTRGSLWIHTGQLVIQCNSRKRERMLRQRLLKNLGDVLTLRDTSHEPFDPVAVSDDQDEPFDLASLSQEDRNSMRELVDSMHMRWADESVPALGGQTPREAVRSSEGRTQVEALLDDFENTHQSRGDADPFDWDRLRQELGLLS